jgi:hypothetical protein
MVTDGTPNPEFEEGIRILGFMPISSTYVPVEVKRLFRNSHKLGYEHLGYYENHRGDFVETVRRPDGVRVRLTAPPTKDVPIAAVNYHTWNASLHPRGPKISYICGACKVPGDERAFRFGRSKEGLLIRCRSCGQLNTLALHIS